jgi:hypothetical protein
MQLFSLRPAVCQRRSFAFEVYPPLIKIVAKALSDEHVFNLEGGRATKAGTPARARGGYTLNPEGQPHSALTATETINLIIYHGEPDEIVSLEIIDVGAG